MAYRKLANLNQIKLKEMEVENVLLFRKQGKTMREIGNLIGKSRTVVKNIIDSNE